MHIVIFSDFNFASLGGVQSSVEMQRSSLKKLGHTVTLVCPASLDVSKKTNDASIIEVPTVPYFHPNGFGISSPSRKNRVFVEHELAKRPRIDCIHAQTNIGLGIIGTLIAKKQHIPLVQTMHGREDVLAERTYAFPALITTASSIIHSKYIPHTSTITDKSISVTARRAWEVMLSQAQAADVVIFASQHFHDKFIQKGMTRRSEVVSNGIDDAIIDELPLPHAKETAGRSLKLLWIGRISAEKNPIMAVDAVRTLKQCSLDIYGDGSYAPKVRSYIKKNVPFNNVQLKGKLRHADAMRAMYEYDALLYTSYDFDNQPMILLEATLAGLPVIFCDPDLAECMPQGGAMLTDSPTADAFTNTIRMLQDTPERITAMSTAMIAARRSVGQLERTRRLVEIYKSLL